MNRAKYIVVRDYEDFEHIIIFPFLLTHADVAKQMNMEVVSAGFVRLGTDIDRKPFVVCYGKSVSLNVQSRGEVDSLLAMKMFVLS